MTKKLNSLAELAAVLSVNTVRTLAAMENSMALAARVVQEDAKERIGEYQEAAGPYPLWEPLAESTEAEKARLGYPPDAPLLRDGTLRDSIVTEHHALEAIIGSKMPVAAFQEFGTSKMPARPFLGPAAFANRKKITRIIGRTATAALSGEVVSSYVYKLLIK